jgi:hypothetical protein
MIKIGLPQIIMVTMYLLSVGMAIAKNGEPKEGNYSFVSTAIATVITVGLLYWGGFFGGAE